MRRARRKSLTLIDMMRMAASSRARMRRRLGARLLEADELDGQVRDRLRWFADPARGGTSMSLSFRRAERWSEWERPHGVSAADMGLDRRTGEVGLRVSTRRASSEEAALRTLFASGGLAAPHELRREPSFLDASDLKLIYALPEDPERLVDLIARAFMEVAVADFAGRFLAGWYWSDERRSGHGHGKAWLDGRLAPLDRSPLARRRRQRPLLA